MVHELGAVGQLPLIVHVPEAFTQSLPSFPPPLVELQPMMAATTKAPPTLGHLPALAISASRRRNIMARLARGRVAFELRAVAR
jgi:hypothetical protein